MSSQTTSSLNLQVPPQQWVVSTTKSLPSTAPSSPPFSPSELSSALSLEAGLQIASDVNTHCLSVLLSTCVRAFVGINEGC